MLYPYLDTSYEDRPGPVNLDEQPTSFSEYLRASRQQTLSLNPVQQTGMVRRLGELDSYDTEYTDEVGGVHQLHKGLSSDDPRARRLSVDEASQAGAPIGLRFSEPPTQAQFDYLADLKRSENSRMRILNQSPGIGTRAAAFISDLAATAIDPVNIASGFVPIVGEARYLRMVSRFGRGPARLLKGAAEGGAGAGLVVPLTLYQARELQQEYGAESALMDVVFGAALGSGIHWAGGRINDAIRRRHYGQIFKYLRENDANMPHPSTFDRRTVRVQDGDNAARHESLTAEERGRVLNAAVKALETDQVPKIDTLFDSDPRLANLSIPDKRFPATVKLQAHMTAADHAIGTRGASIIDMAVSRELTEAKKPATPGGLFSLFSKRYKKLSEYSLKTVPPAEFGQRVGNALEHPDQRVAIEEGSKTILVTEGASLGAVRHEIERALDDVYKVDSTARGGYRYRGSDADRLNAHRAAVGEQFDEFPDRAPQTISPRSAIDEFSRRDQPILGAEGPQVSAHIDEVVNREKDVKLDKMISEEEVPALESIVSNIQGRARDLGIMDKVIPAEEREIMTEDATRAGQGDLVRDLFKAGDKAVEDDVKALTISDAEILMRAGPEKLAEIIKGEKPTEAVIKEAADTGLVTRVNAAKDIKFYLKRSKQELDGEGLERAIRAVQNGEDIDVAVNRETQAAKPEAGEPPVRDEEPAPSEDQEVADAKSFVGEDEFDDMLADATAILEVGRIDDKRDLVKGEAQIVKEEHEALEKLPKARDLYSSVERDEFDEADRDRALRQGDGAGEGGTGGGAGGRSAGDTASARLQAAVVGRDSETVGGAQPAIERERAAPGGERPAPETTLSYGGWAIPRRVITPDGSVQVGIEPRIVEFTTLAYERAEERVTSFMRAMEFDPGRMLPSNISDTGAPLVYPNPDGTYSVISGRKRSASLAEIYLDETLEFKALQYRERLGPAADGYRNPVLVSVITDLATPAELDALAKASNSERISGLKTAEQYRQDASRIAVMALYKGGDVTSKQNRDFVQIFTKYLTSAEEREAFSKKGKLTSAGIDRLNAAIFSAAYDDTDTLSRMIVSADPNIKSIAHAYRDVAPAFMKLRREIAQGLVREDMDITASMMRAASLAEEMQDKGVKIIDAISKIDALDPVVDRLIRQFYNPQMTKVNSPLRIAGNLQRFIDGAREKLVQREVDTETVAGVDRQAGVDARTGEQIDDAEEILTAADENAGRSSAGSGQAAPQPASAEPGPVADLRGARGSAEAPARPAAEGRYIYEPLTDTSSYEGRRFYHGTKGPIEKISDADVFGFGDAESLYGIGLYLTDNPAVAKSYAETKGRGGPGKVLAGELADIRVIDLEKPLPDDAKKVFRKAMDEVMMKRQIDDALSGNGKTAFDDYRDAMESEGLTKSEALENLQNLAVDLGKLGYDGLRHEGGQRVNRNNLGPHNVVILFENAGFKDGQRVGKGIKENIRDVDPNAPVTQPAAERRLGSVSPKTDKIFDQFIADVKKAKEPAVAPVAPSDLRTQLEGMKVPAIREKAKAEGLTVKGRSKEQIIDSYIKAVEGKKPASSISLEAAYLKHLGGKFGNDVEIAELKKEFPNMSLDAFHDMLRDEQRKGALYLSRIDDPSLRSEKAVAAQIPIRNARGDVRDHYHLVTYREKPVVPEAKPVPSTLQDFTRASGWASAADRMDALKNDGASLLKRGAFLGKAKVIAERLVKKADMLQSEILARDLEGAGDTLKDMVDDAARLHEIDPRPESNAVTQWVRSAAREVNIADKEAKAIEAIPVKEEKPQVFDTPEDAVRTAFYDFLEGGKPLKGSQQLANELGIDPNQAYLLLDEAENLGWIKLKSNGVYIRVPRERRPLRPDVKFEDGEAMGDVVQFQPRQTPLMQRLSTLNNRESAINAELSRAADEVDVLRAADAPSEQIDDAMFRNNELLAQLNEIQEEIASVRDQIDNRIDGEAAGEVPRGWGAVDDLTEAQRFERDLQSSLAIQRAVADGLKRVPESVQIQILDKMEIAGFGPARGGMFPYTMPNGVRGALIQVLRGVGDAVNLVNHEIFHALRTLGLFSKLEWRIVKEAMAEKSGLSKETLARYEPYMRMRAEMMDLHPSMDKHFIDDKLVEERAARDFGEWISKRGSERGTAIGRLWGRAKDFMEDLRQSFTNIGRRARGLQEKPSLEQIYRAIEDGSFALRYQEWGLGRAGADNPLSVNRQAGDEFAAMLNRDMRAIAHDDSESIAKATETALTHLAPCAAYHL